MPAMSELAILPELVMTSWAGNDASAAIFGKISHGVRTVNDESADNAANAPRIADNGNTVNYDSAANAATNAHTDYNVSSPNGARADRAAIDGSAKSVGSVANPASVASAANYICADIDDSAANDASACSDCESVQYHIMFSKQATLFCCYLINCLCTLVCQVEQRLIKKWEKSGVVRRDTIENPITNNQPTGLNLDRLINSRIGRTLTVHLLCFVAKRASLKLKARPRLLGRSLPLRVRRCEMEIER
jgi:hypothetical protein